MQNILWIHGFPLSARVFARQRAIVAAHVMPNLPGFGGTMAAEGPLSMDDYAQRALAAMPARKFILAGLSMGGYVAFAAARIARERVKGLILLDTRETADSEAQRKGRYDSIAQVNAAGSVAPVVEAMLPKMLTKDATPDLVNEVRWIMEASAPRGVVAALEAMANRPDSTDLLPTLDIPALVIAGEDDAITPPSDAARMAQLLPNAKLVTIPNAAHLANVERGLEVNAAVDEWLAGLR